MRPSALLPAICLLASCANELRLELPPPPEGAQSSLVAIEGHHDELILIAQELDGTPAITSFTFDTRADRLTLIYLAEPLEDLGVVDGPLGPSAGAEGAAIPQPAKIFEATFAEGALEKWSERAMLPDRVREYRVPKNATPDACATFDSSPLALALNLPISFSVAIDDRSALIGTAECRMFRIDDPGDETTPVPVELRTSLGLCGPSSRYSEAIRDDDGVLWLGRQDGNVDRFEPPLDVRNPLSEPTETRSFIMSMTASRGTQQRELYAISKDGKLQRRDTGGWRAVWQDPVDQGFRQIAWIAPGELLVVDGTACLRRWKESDRNAIDACEPVGEGDTLPLISSAALIPGIGSVVGAGVFGGAFAGYGALFGNDSGVPGRWSLLALMQPFGVIISPTVIVPLDGGLFYGGLANMIGQYHPPAVEACDVRQLGAEEKLTSWADIVSFAGGERMLLTGVPVEMGASPEDTAEWVVRRR